jgi:cytochrome c-type biogenesis protein CcmF
MFLEASKLFYCYALMTSSIGLIFYKNQHQLIHCLAFISFSTFLTLAALLYAFVQHDYSVAYVAQHSSNTLPLLLQAAALWAGHEGSTLLFLFFVSTGSTITFVILKKIIAELNPLFIKYSLLNATLLAWFIFIAANPFKRLLPFPPLDGNDLNPLLHDVSLSYHPPLLLLGTALFFPVALLNLFNLSIKDKKADHLYLFFLYAALGILTAGITFGSIWAYHVLGWGGFWFWDPVETLSLLPWFGGFALIHMHRSGKRSFLANYLWLVILLGMLMVRSNYIVSVHAFAQAQTTTQGLSILLITMSLMTLYLHYDQRKNIIMNQQNSTSFFGGQGLVLMLFILLFGLLYPVMIFWQKDSIHLSGDFYNQVLPPMMLAFMTLWVFKKYSIAHTKILALLVFMTISFTGDPWIHIVIAGLFFLIGFFHKQSLSTLSHQVVLFFMILLYMHAAMKYEYEYKIKVGEPIYFKNNILEIISIKTTLDSPYQHILKADIQLTLADRTTLKFHPEKILYKKTMQEIAPIAIHPGLYHEYCICLGDNIDNEYFLIRVYFKPFVRLIWLSAMILSIMLIYTAYHCVRMGSNQKRSY